MNILKNKKKKKGFTLIELIVVIAIIVVLALIIIPQIIGYTSKASTSQIEADAKTMEEVIDVNNSDSTKTAIGDVKVNTLTDTTKYDQSVTDAVSKLGKDTTVLNANVSTLDHLAENGN